MAKPGLKSEDFSHQLKGIFKKNGWVLCVGAGITNPVFPNWKNLIRKLIHAEDESRESNSEEVLFKNLVDSFSLDALLEAARDRLKLDTNDFSEKLSENLYSDFRNKVKNDWNLVARALSASSPGDMTPRSKWKTFIDIIEKNYPDLTAKSLAEAVVDANESGVPPSAIISFNAEPLFYSLVTGITAVRHSPEEPDSNSTPRRLLDKLTRQTSNRELWRIPYFFCHGLLPFQGCSARFKKESDLGKLVFSEGEYLALANSSFAWQSSIFLSNCLFRTFIFVGVSLSDPNMRRWLAWIHASRRTELMERGIKGNSTQHYWLTKHPKSADEARWMESAVAHLGVRIIWLREWGDAGTCLKNALK